MLKQPTRDEPIGKIQGEYGVKRKLDSLEQQLPMSANEKSTGITSTPFVCKESEQYSSESTSTHRAASNGAMMFSGFDPNLVSEASNSDTGSARGSVTLGSDEEVVMS